MRKLNQFMEFSNLNDFTVRLVADINAKVNEQLSTLRNNLTTSATENNSILSDRIQVNSDLITDIQTSIDAIIGINTAQSTTIDELNSEINKLNHKKVIEIYSGEEVGQLELTAGESIIFLNSDDLKIYRREVNDQNEVIQTELGHLAPPEQVVSES